MENTTISKYELSMLRNKLANYLCDKDRQVRTMGFVDEKTSKIINRLQNEFKKHTGATLHLVFGNLKEIKQ